MKRTLLVLAAGLSSRYGGIKQIAPVGPNGEILLHYAIHDAVAAGFNKIVFVIKRAIEQDFKIAIGNFAESRAEICYAFQDEAYLPEGYVIPPQRTKMLGTVQALLAAKDLIREPFAIINADDYYGKEAYALCAQQLDQIAQTDDHTAGCLIGYPLSNTLSDNGTVNRGICNVEHGFLHSIREMYQIQASSEGSIVDKDGTCLSKDSIASMNFWGFHPSIFQHAQALFDQFIASLQPEDIASEYILTAMVDDLIRAQKLRVKVVPCQSNWMGITYAADRAAVSQVLSSMQEKGIYPSILK